MLSLRWNFCALCWISAGLATSTAATPCCQGPCKSPLVKMFSTDAPHGFCGEACMDPKKFKLYKVFEANLTVATSEHPCSQQLTPSNKHRYTDYFGTVTHGGPGLSVTLDLYAPTAMPDHSCCWTPLVKKLNCFGIPGYPTSLSLDGTGPYCCPKGATETTPCAKHDGSLKETEELAVFTPAKQPCCQGHCDAPLVKMFSTDAPHGFCGEACMDPKKFKLYKVFEPNLTVATSEHPCSKQWTPSNKHHYTVYFDTVTHGGPGLSVTLDLYAPYDMPDHSCCWSPLVKGLNCFGIPGYPTSLTLDGTGPYCCPKGATEITPCPKNDLEMTGTKDLTVSTPTKSPPCCQGHCQAPLVKMFSTDAPHGFCGEACMDPKKFKLYKVFEANLTVATSEHPCSQQLTPSNKHRYTDYFDTVTHGGPGLSVTLDLYAPTAMPDHSCCWTPLVKKLNCFGIPGYPISLFLDGTGPYCCPKGATEKAPCGPKVESLVIV